MDKQYNVLKNFDISIKVDDIEILEKTHSYIGNNLILDAINGVNVVAKDLHETNKEKTNLIIRAREGITGESKKRENLFDEILIYGLGACIEWLKDHNNHFTRVDKKIGDVAKALDNTQNEILKFYSEHKKLEHTVDEIKQVINEFRIITNNRIESLTEHIKHIDIRTKSMELIDLEISRLNAKKYKHLAIPLQIYTVLNNLKSGYCGIYYDNICDDKEKYSFQERIENELLAYYDNKCALKELLNYEQLSLNIAKYPLIQKQALSIISTQHYNEMIEKKFYPEVSDLISILTTCDTDKVMESIEKKSNIRTFFTYEDYISMSLDEHLKV